MRTNYKIAVWGMLILCTLYTFAQGQSLTPSIDPEREVVVMFKSDAVIPPANRTAGRPDEFQIPERGLRQLLLNANVEAISRLMPEFRPEDRYAVNRTGEEVQLTDWTQVYVIRLPQPQAREGFLNALKNRPEVIFAELHGRGEPDLIPNDQYFNRQWALKNDGTWIQGSGTPGADIKATQAWDITTGSSSIKVGIVDNGIQTNHPDFAGRVTGDTGDNSSHGTGVTGVAGAQGNNTTGIAGVAWNVGIINEDYGSASDADLAAAVRSAANRGADVINNSWKLIPVGRYSTAVRLAFADVYKLNRAAVASMGNQGGEVVQYPSAFGQGIITVGATTNTDVKAVYSSTGNWIDVVAPGGAGSGSSDEKDDIYTTTSGSSYAYMAGTSFATPVATGIAALLLSYNPNLYNDDIEQIIRLGVDDKGDPGFDTWYGTGRVNARKALDYLRSPYVLNHKSASGGSTYSSTGTYTATMYGVPGLADGVYLVKRYEVRKSVNFGQTYQNTHVWGRGVGTNGFSAANPNYGMGWCDVVSNNNSSATLRTYVYEIWTIAGTYVGWKPTSPSNTSFKYTIMGKLVPPPPLSVTITGPTYLNNGQTGTFTANASGGTGNYTNYKWWRRNDGSGVPPKATGNFETDDVVPKAPPVGYWIYNSCWDGKASITTGPSFNFSLKCEVTDSDNNIATDIHSVIVGGFLLSKKQRDNKANINIPPTEVTLSGNYPNPFNPSTTIKFGLPEAQHVSIRIYSINGAEVKTLVDDLLSEGYYQVFWNGLNQSNNKVASGIYIYEMRTKNKRFLKKMLITK